MRVTAARSACVVWGTQECAAPHDPVGATLRTERIVGRAGCKVRRAVPIYCPLPDITCHVIGAHPTFVVRVMAYWRRIRVTVVNTGIPPDFGAAFIAEIDRIRFEGIAPRIDERLRAKIGR